MRRFFFYFILLFNNTMKDRLDTLINKHYAELLKVANKFSRNSGFTGREVLSYSVLKMYELMPKSLIDSMETDDKFFRFCCKHIYQTAKWSNSGLKNSSRDIMITVYFEEYHEDMIGDTDTVDLLEIEFDYLSDKEKEMMIDSLSGHLYYEKAKKYNALMKVRQKLLPHEKILFDEYFIANKTGIQIAKERLIPMSKASVYQMIQALKIKIQIEVNKINK